MFVNKHRTCEFKKHVDKAGKRRGKSGSGFVDYGGAFGVWF